MRLLLGTGCLLWGASACAATMAPYVPASDAVVLQEVPSRADPRVQAFEQARVRLQAHPGDVDAAAALAHGYIDYARATGDARYLGRGLAVLAPWLSQARPPTPILLLQATILQSRHQFASAKDVLGRVLQADADNPQAWLTLAAVDQVQADMSGARRACAHLFGGMDALALAGCLGALNTVTGRAQSAYDVVSTLLAQEPGEPAGVKAWALGILADAALALGRPALAEQHYRAALALAPGDAFLVAGYADFLIDAQRAGEALVLVRPLRGADTAFLRQVRAEQVLGLPAAAADRAEMAQRFADCDVRGDHALYAREEAQFALWVEHDGARALRLAQDDWSLQRAPEDQRLLVESALAAGQPQAAAPAVALARDTHLEDPRVLRAIHALPAPAASAGRAS